MMPLTRTTRLAATAFGFVIIGAAAAAAQQSERVTVGQQAPAFTLTSTDGSQVSLESQRDQGSVVLVFFRGTW